MTMGIRLALLIFLALKIILVKSNSVVTTNVNATAYRGRSIYLPCRFQGTAIAVYWYRHNTTGAPDDRAKTVAQFFEGGIVLNDDFPRFNLTSEYTLVISNVRLEDETTYSCRVAFDGGSTGQNYTDLTVIALADPINPVVRDCEQTEPGKCDYVVATVDTESFDLTCRVDDVRPAVDLSWWTVNTEVRTPAEDAQVVADPDGSGAFNVISVLKVSKSEIGESFVCKAEGVSVNGASTLVASVKFPPETGLSAGGKAGISIVVLLIVLGSIVGAVIGYFVWKRRNERRDQKDGDPEAVPLSSPGQTQFEELKEQINNYRPGKFSNLEAKEGRIFPEFTRLGVYGVTHVGKSSLVRSLTYSLKGTFSSDLEVAQSYSIGGVTIKPTKYSITDHISIVDNRGLKDLDTSCIAGIMEQIRGISKQLEGSVDFPILVFDARQPVEAMDKFLPDFVKEIRKEFGSYPAIVFTHKDSIGDNMDTIKAQVTGMGALDQKLYFIENFTEEPTEPCFERRLEFLEILKNMLECADANIICRVDRKSGGNGSASYSAMGDSSRGSTSGLKAFRSIFKK